MLSNIAKTFVKNPISWTVIVLSCVMDVIFMLAFRKMAK